MPPPVCISIRKFSLFSLPLAKNFVVISSVVWFILLLSRVIIILPEPVRTMENLTESIRIKTINNVVKEKKNDGCRRN